MIGLWFVPTFAAPVATQAPAPPYETEPETAPPNDRPNLAKYLTDGEKGGGALLHRRPL